MKFLLKQLNDIGLGGFKVLLKKIYVFFFHCLKLPLYLYGLILCILLTIIKPIISFKVQKLPAENFGDFVFLTSLYHLKKNILKDKKYKSIDLLFINSKFYNKQVKKMISRKLTIYPKFLINPLYEVINMLSFFKDLKIPLFSNRFEYDEENLFEKYESISFTSNEIVKGNSILEKFGLKKEEKFICLAVRDNKFSKKKSEIFSIQSDKDNNFRNCNVENFLSAADFFTKKGLYVFRMGREAERKIQTNNPKIIDYVNSNMKSDFMDIFLGAKCEFCISTGYGFDAIPYVFNKPIALITVPIGDFRAHSKRIFFLTKKHFDTKLNKYLSLQEIFKKGLAFSYTSKNFDDQKIRLIEPNLNEVQEFVEEFYEKIYKKNEFSEQDIKLQNMFKYNYMKYFNSINYPLNKKKYYKNLHKNFTSFFSTAFLKNSNWSS
jgi:putative glycosyltransferase (TIGR04372 family)